MTLLSRFRSVALLVLLLTITVLAQPPGPATNVHVNAPTLPGGPTNQNPLNGATNVPLNQALTWTPGANTATMNIKFGACPSPPTVVTGTVATTYSPVGMTNSTTYCWQIVDINSSGGQVSGPVLTFTTTAGGGGGGSALLTSANITCAGVFKGPAVSSGNQATSTPVAYRREGTARHYFVQAGDGHIYEFPEPALSPCNTGVGSITTATLEGWGGDWGPIVVNAGIDGTCASPGCIPGWNATYIFGMAYDNTLGALVVGWVSTYSSVPSHNNFATITPNDTTHTLVTRGCHQMAGYNTQWVGSGMLNIPDAYVTAHLGATQRWAVLGGGQLGYAASASFGPVMLAVTPPAANPCASGVDYPVLGTITALEQHPANSSGPNCVDSPTTAAYQIGCTPVQTPTNPLPKLMAFTNYSTAVYNVGWDPYAGHGWYSYGTYFSTGWYDDGVKAGILNPIEAASGWINTTALSSPLPAGTYPNYSFRITSVAMHDGFNLNPGDLIWVQSCTPGVDSNCLTANADHMSGAVIDTVNPATGDVTYHVSSVVGPDSSALCSPVITATCGRVIPGGTVVAGGIYAHGTPDFTRGTYRLQITDPARITEVIGGTRSTWDVPYAEEIDLTTYVKALGAPSLGGGASTLPLGHKWPVSTMIDTANHQFMVAFNKVNDGAGGVDQVVIYVFNVSPTP